MRVLVSSEYRFFHVPEQGYFTSASFPYSFWTRYLDVFERVEILARALPASHVEPRWKRVDGERVGFVTVPHYLGPAEFLRNVPGVASAIAKAANTRGAVILRLASVLGVLLDRRLAAEARPFGVELVGDPYSTFAPGATRHPARPVLRRLFTYSTRALCRRACAVAYVTKHDLQQRYPASPSAFTTNYSSIELAESAFVAPASRTHRRSGPYVITCVGSLEQMYKAPDVLIDSVHSLQQGGIDVRLRIIGDGRHRPELETYVRRLGMAHTVDFCGHIAPEQVLAELDGSDLFVLPSRTEGTPRALIEAMARGLPAVATQVGGVPELLDDDCLVEPSDARALASKIRMFLASPERRASAGEQNLSRARSFEESLLRPRRNEMYRQVLDRTARWQQLTRQDA